MQKIKVKCDKLLIIDSFLATDLSPLIVQLGFRDFRKLQTNIFGVHGKLLFLFSLSLSFFGDAVMLKYS
jgi:hypothetical protein